MSSHRQQFIRSARLFATALLMLFSVAVTAQANGATSQQQAAQIALQQSGGGKVLGVSTETDASGRRVFAVKVLSTNGRVRVIRIPQK